MKWMYVFLLLLVASCKNEALDAEAKTKALNEMQTKVHAVIEQVKADCDSNLYNMARYKADSIKHKTLRAR